MRCFLFHHLLFFVFISYSCKTFLEVTEADHFYGRMSLEHFPICCGWGFPRPQLSGILDKCIRNNNSDALFIKAVVCIYILRYRKYDECYTLYNCNVIVNFFVIIEQADYFCGNDAEKAFKCLTETSRFGHAVSSYAMAIIMFFRGSESKEEGMRLLTGMTETTTQRRDVKNFRGRVKKILMSIWLNNKTVLNQKALKFCWLHRKRARRGWEPEMEEIDREDGNLLCVGCLCDEELHALFGSLRGVNLFQD